jgi:hypothetical protein
MIWLGQNAGYLSDWLTQQWVCATGRPIDLRTDSWLEGPIGKTRGIGADVFEQLARESGWRRQADADVCGLIPSFDQLRGPAFDPAKIQPEVARFYERASEYDLDAWAQWCGFFKPFGSLLALLFSRRLQQLNVPLSGLDTSRGISSQIIQFVEGDSDEIRLTAWVRKLVGTQNVLYAGSYSICRPPLAPGPCIKVVFPLPNGNAMVIMRPEAHEDASFSVVSSGRGFGDAGFYFTVHSRDRVRARYVKAMRERIHVFRGDDGVRADHTLWIFGLRFLQLHYRLREKRASEGIRL